MKLFVIKTSGRLASFSAAVFLICSSVFADHQVLLQGGSRLAIVDADGSISWEMPWGGIHEYIVWKMETF